MTDPPPESGSDEGDADASRPPPQAARAATAPSEAGIRNVGDKHADNRLRDRGRRSGRSRAKRRGGVGKDPDSPRPLSARAMAQTGAGPAPVEPDVVEIAFEVDGQGWIVRLLGRSGGSAPGATPLLLLGFWQAGNADGDAELETLVVGRTLTDLSTPSLEDALSRATPYSAEPRRVELFGETSERRRR